MNAILWRVAVVVMAIGAGQAGAQELYKTAAGPYKVQQKDQDWRDEGRKRDVPVRVYVPRSAGKVEDGGAAGAGAVEKPTPTPLSGRGFPLIVFSHGMGGSRKAYGYICEHLASHGYVVVVPTHEGSDTEGVRKEIGDRIKKRLSGEGKPGEGLIVENTGNPENLRSRPKDVSFVIDCVAKDAELSKIVDTERIGVAGHSFGAYTAMVEGGMLVDLPEGKGQNLRDARVKAVVPMSPEGHGIMGIDAGAWDRFAVPVLFLTGTKDYGQGQRSASWRREAFEAIKTVDEFLVVIEGAGHMTFADGAKLGAGHAHHIELIKAVATAWFDAQLKGDEKAAVWLKVFSMGKHGDCTVEYRPKGKGKK